MSVPVKIELDVIEPGRPSERDYRRRKLLYFAVANAIALVVAAAIFFLLLVGIPEGQGFDRAMDRVRQFLRSHMGLTALAASTPFFASILVGQYEARRARARRRRQEAEARRREVAAALARDDVERSARRAARTLG